MINIPHTITADSTNRALSWFLASSLDPTDQTFAVAISLLLAGGIGAVSLMIGLSIAKERREKSNQPPLRLLDELSRAHGLSSRQRKLLNQLTVEAELENPGVIVVLPQTFDNAIAQTKTGREKAKHFQRIRERFFGASEEK